MRGVRACVSRGWVGGFWRREKYGGSGGRRGKDQKGGRPLWPPASGEGSEVCVCVEWNGVPVPVKWVDACGLCGNAWVWVWVGVPPFLYK